MRDAERHGRGSSAVRRASFTATPPTLVRLIEAGPKTTLWVSESEYRFSGVLMRLVGLLMPGAFRKQSLQHMQDFKAFAEQGTDVRDAKD